MSDDVDVVSEGMVYRLVQSPLVSNDGGLWKSGRNYRKVEGTELSNH